MTIQIDDNQNIRIISLNRPEKLNAITLEMATEMNKSNDWINNEIKDFQELSLRYQLK